MPHSDIMGVAVSGGTLYLGSFVGMGGHGGGAVYSMPLRGGKPTPVVTGFKGATDALAANNGYPHVGGSTSKGGYAYRIKL